MREQKGISALPHRTSHRLVTAAALILAAIDPSPLSAAALTATPTMAPTPRRTGDLGEKEVSGRVVDAGDGSGIEGASVSYHRLGRHTADDVGGSTTGPSGEFSFRLSLHDTDQIRISASAEGYAYDERVFTGIELWTGPPLEIALPRLSGDIEISPDRAQRLACEADASVTIRNSASASGPLTITALSATNSYSQGDYGTGFTADLDGIALPLTLAPGESVEFPVHYSAAGQDFPSHLTVRLESSAGAGFAVPYRGEIAGCGAPTPTPTPLRTPACAGDCDNDGRVTIDELVRGVGLVLGRQVEGCGNFDLDASGAVAVHEVVAAVSASLTGCAPN